MAAPLKTGLDYFSFDVDLLDDERLDFLREKYGVMVNDIYICLLCLLYRKKGYYIPYETVNEKRDCVWYVFQRVRGGRHPVQQEAIPKVIEDLVAMGLFSGDYYPKIITSARAQRTYYKATVERELDSFDITPDRWMLSEEEMRKLSKRHPYYLYLTQKNNSDDLLSNSSDLLSNSDDLTLNKSKVNKSKLKDIEESKKASKEKNYQSYDEIFDEFGVGDFEKEAYLNFIRHLLANGTVLINDRLQTIIVKLDELFGNDWHSKVKYINDAISKGFKRLPCEGYE